MNIATVLKLMSRHPDVLPFLVHIASEEKHVVRMAVRAKYMTLDPHKNRSAVQQGAVWLAGCLKLKFLRCAAVLL